MHFNSDSDTDETNPAPASSKYPTLLILLDLQLANYSLYSKQDVSQLHAVRKYVKYARHLI